MNSSKDCVPYVCTGSGRKQVCERHDIYFIFYPQKKSLTGRFVQLTMSDNRIVALESSSGI